MFDSLKYENYILLWTEEASIIRLVIDYIFIINLFGDININTIEGPEMATREG
jgi:hypothetical protein